MKLPSNFILLFYHSFINHTEISAVPDTKISVILHLLWLLCSTVMYVFLDEMFKLNIPLLP